MSDNILPRIRKMEKQSDKLKKQGKNLKALEVLEKTLLLKMELYDISSDAVWDTCKSIAEFCNSLALLYLSKDNLTLTHELLKKSLILTENQGWDSQNDAMRLKVRAITYNNIACACQKQENFHTALKNLERALRIEGQLDTVNPSGTHLNICAVLSHLGRHADALEHAKAAVILVEDLERELEERKREQGFDEDEFGEVDEEEQRQQEEAQSIKAAAYYNMGAEHEYLRQYKEALDAYDGARQVCHMAFGAKHPMTKQMKVAYQDAEKAMKKYQMAKVKRIKKTRGAIAAAVAVEEMGLAPQGKKKHKKKKKKQHKPHVRYDAEDDEIDQQVAAAAAKAEKENTKLKEEDLADFDDGEVEDHLGMVDDGKQVEEGEELDHEEEEDEE